MVMNANELADKLQTIRKSIWYDIDHVVAKFVDETTNEAATMLRQQHAELTQLKNLLLDNQILLDKTLNAWAKEMERRK